MHRHFRNQNYIRFNIFIIVKKLPPIPNDDSAEKDLLESPKLFFKEIVIVKQGKYHCYSFELITEEITIELGKYLRQISGIRNRLVFIKTFVWDRNLPTRVKAPRK